MLMIKTLEKVAIANALKLDARFAKFVQRMRNNCYFSASGQKF